MLPISSFKSNGLLVQEKKRKTNFQDSSHGSYLGFPIRTILSFFWSTSHPDASYQVSSQLAFGSGEEAKNRFSRWLLGFPIGKILAIFGLQVTWMFPTKSIGFSVQERKWIIDFQNGGQLGFSMGKILASFDLQVIPMLLTKFQVNWPFGSGEEKIDFFKMD